ncbi:MAG: hypothetical protein IJE78_11730 [Bacteroidaceae bacterium]|nr:hypothetical protein [Bacteroidaceae bacterium]
MDKTQTRKSKLSEKSEVKGIFKKMIADKRAVQAHIRMYGTLEGFKNENVIFAKPL